MTLAAIRAHFQCDGCNAPMSFDLDAAAKFPSGSTLHDAAIDAVRGGVTRDGGLSSVQAEQCLCDKCTKIVDAAVPEDRNATLEEVERALNKAAGV